MCDEEKLTFKLNHNYDVTEMLKKNETNWYLSSDEIYLKVKSKIKIIPFGKFSPDSTNINILPFVTNTHIIDNLHNKKLYQELDNFDILRFNDGIYFSGNIIYCFLMWMK